MARTPKGGGGGAGSGSGDGVAPGVGDRTGRGVDDTVETKPEAGSGAPSLEERRVRALEDIAVAMNGVRGHLVDVSLWLAHIGRNLPPDLRR